MKPKPLELTTALEAARRAAGVCTEIYQNLVEKAEKAGREPVTIADYASQAIINATLRDAFPNDDLIGEEHASDFQSVLTDEQRTSVVNFASQGLGRTIDEDDVKRTLDWSGGNSGHTWIVDPIDGTKGFLAKRAYAIAIAMRDAKGLSLGVIACPNLSLENPGELTDQGVIFYAVRGQGAFYEPLEGGDAVRMQVSSTGQNLLIATSVESKHSDQDLFEKVVAALPGEEKSPLRLDGQGKYGLVAAGLVTCYFRLVPDENYREKIWDHAAGAIIVEEAGGRVSDFSGAMLNFMGGEKMDDNRGIVVSNGHLHDSLLQAIADA